MRDDVHVAPVASPGFPALTPTSFLDRSALVFADRTAVVDGPDRWTYAQFADRCRRQAGLFVKLGLDEGDRIAVLAPNTHYCLELHYAVPYAGMVLVALNTRLAADELRYIIEHADCRLVLVDPRYADLAAEVLGDDCDRVVVTDADYELRIAESFPLSVTPRDERGLISLNYTSGTTGRPKGVMYHHRGAYLQALAMPSHFQLTSDSRFLWTLPMFHCNGWCFTWAVTAVGGTHVCLPKVDPEQVWELIHTEGVTHFCGAPTVLTSLTASPAARPPADRRVVAAIGGSPPAPALLERCAELSLDVTHLYGLTETFGPAAICEWRTEWDSLPAQEQAERRARQGVGTIVTSGLRVVDDQGLDIARDGTAVGEIAVRGNNLMLGYYRDRDATAAAIPDGWFRTGDLAVMHDDGYLEIRDRAKDVIISGGENISSVEVEFALISHPAVLEAAVVAQPSPQWGERPLAWVTLREGQNVTEDELRTYVRGQLAGFKVPDRVLFGSLPKTASGKIRKDQLRGRIETGSPTA